MRSLVALAGAVALVAAAPAGAAAPSAAGSSATARVALKNIKFTPSTVRIKRGDRVTWTWQEPVFHDIKSKGALRFRGASMRKTGSHTVRFTKAGTYRYVCTLHPGMDGKVVVR